jgi:hypothetical protein
MTRTILILCAIAAALVFPSVAANAVEDVTAPVLTDFTLTSSASIDTGPASVSFAWTATATDNLSGVRRITAYITAFGGGGTFGNSSANQFTPGDLEFTDSGSATIPRYAGYATYNIFVNISDHAGNARQYQANVPEPYGESSGHYDLCDVDTPCQIVNAAP